MPASHLVVHCDSGILSGAPVFVGTRVPVKTLYDYLEAGDSLDAFLKDFPSVAREQAVAALEMAREMTEARARTPHVEQLEAALLSEAALSVDWDRPEEDRAWSHLDQG